MNSQTKVIIGSLVAAALGTVIVGLFATDEGRKTRKKLAKKTRKMRNKTLQQVGELKVSARRKYAAVKQTANELIDEGREKVSNLTGHSAETVATSKMGKSGSSI